MKTPIGVSEKSIKLASLMADFADGEDGEMVVMTAITMVIAGIIAVDDDPVEKGRYIFKKLEPLVNMIVEATKDDIPTEH